MEKLAADLHIHSCLSPCGDMDMTPNNIVNMAYVKGLQAIAVCDHNSVRNLPAVQKAADERGLILLPGLEVETREEVHMLAYFPSVESAQEFGEWVYARLPDLENMPDFFGEQAVLDENDERIGTEQRMLLQSTTISIDDLAARCRQMGGVPVPAHINRTSNSLLYNLGFVPQQLQFATLEVYQSLPVQGVELGEYHIIYNSDAHYLESISEPVHFISTYERSPEGILRWLSEPKQQ